MPDVQRSPEVRADLLQIWLYVAERNPRAADQLLDLIDQKCRLLSEMPGMGRARPELRPDLLSFPGGRFLIFYRPMGDAGVEIVRGGRDLAALFEA